jgi:hypothetical protein
MSELNTVIAAEAAIGKDLIKGSRATILFPPIASTPKSGSLQVLSDNLPHHLHSPGNGKVVRKTPSISPV